MNYKCYYFRDDPETMETPVIARSEKEARDALVYFAKIYEMAETHLGFVGQQVAGSNAVLIRVEEDLRKVRLDMWRAIDTREEKP